MRSTFACKFTLLLVTTTLLSRTTTTAFTARTMPSATASSTTDTTSASTSRSATTQQTTTVDFAKYNGLGNDFILIDDRDKLEPSLSPQQAAQLCHRNFGVGGDGVIFALQTDKDDDKDDDNFDFKMRIYNSDGSEPEMCGNGIRCLAQFVKDLGQQQEKQQNSYNIETLAGPIVPVMNDDGTITVDMGEPILDGPSVPTTLTPNFDHNSVVEQRYVCNDKEWKISAVSMGNPHAIVFVDDLENDIDFELDGPALESCDAFPARTNVEFVQVVNDSHVRMKVWERGAGPTLACGTGACALVVAAMLAGRISRPDNVVQVTLPGGDLFIEWKVDDNKVYMTGPATFSFSGTAQV